MLGQGSPRRVLTADLQAFACVSVASRDVEQILIRVHDECSHGPPDRRPRGRPPLYLSSDGPAWPPAQSSPAPDGGGPLTAFQCQNGTNTDPSIGRAIAAAHTENGWSRTTRSRGGTPSGGSRQWLARFESAWASGPDLRHPALQPECRVATKPQLCGEEVVIGGRLGALRITSAPNTRYPSFDVRNQRTRRSEPPLACDLTEARS